MDELKDFNFEWSVTADNSIGFLMKCSVLMNWLIERLNYSAGLVFSSISFGLDSIFYSVSSQINFFIIVSDNSILMYLFIFIRYIEFKTSSANAQNSPIVEQ